MNGTGPGEAGGPGAPFKYSVAIQPRADPSVPIEHGAIVDAQRLINGNESWGGDLGGLFAFLAIGRLPGQLRYLVGYGLALFG